MHYVTLATKLLHVVLFYEDMTQQDLKNPTLGMHVIRAYAKFQQCQCITFEDVNIFLSAIFIFCGLILLLVAEISETRTRRTTGAQGYKFGLSGTILHYLALSGTISGNLGLYQTILDSLGLSGTIWDYLRLSGII